MRRFILVGVLASIAVAGLLAPFASDLPDGLERIAQKLGFISRASEEGVVRAPLPDYGVAGVRNERLSTAIAGVTGALAAFGAAFLAALAVRRAGRRK